MALTLETCQEYLEAYGLFAIFFLMYLEYLNLPGLPAGLVMPLTGLWACQRGMSFVAALLFTTLAGLLGCLTIYLVGRWAGRPVLRWICKKFPRQAPRIDSAIAYVERKGQWGVLVGRLVPVIRTQISLPAGMLQMAVFPYLLFTTAGVCLWNLFFVGAGYYFGPQVVEQLFHF